MTDYTQTEFVLSNLRFSSNLKVLPSSAWTPLGLLLFCWGLCILIIMMSSSFEAQARPDQLADSLLIVVFSHFQPLKELGRKAFEVALKINLVYCVKLWPSVHSASSETGLLHPACLLTSMHSPTTTTHCCFISGHHLTHCHRSSHSLTTFSEKCAGYISFMNI